MGNYHSGGGADTVMRRGGERREERGEERRGEGGGEGFTGDERDGNSVGEEWVDMGMEDEYCKHD